MTRRVRCRCGGWRSACWRRVDWEYIRHNEYTGDLSDVVSAALSVSESPGSCAIRRDEYNGDEYNGGKYDGNAENDDTWYGELNAE